MNVRNAQEVLVGTLPLAEISEPEAKSILEHCRTTPLEFFGGQSAQFVEDLRLNLHELHALDYATVRSVAEFRGLAGPADVIVAVDFASGDVQLLYGCLNSLAAAQEGHSQLGRGCHFIFFALDFDKDTPGVEGATELEHFAASVVTVKGSCWINGEQYSPPL